MKAFITFLRSMGDSIPPHWVLEKLTTRRIEATAQVLRGPRTCNTSTAAIDLVVVKRSSSDRVYRTGPLLREPVTTKP